jgi:hypothetical protein
MIINISYDSSVNSAPAAFRTVITAAIQFLDNIFTNPITINVDVGYGEVNGQPLDSGALGESETFFNNYTYTQIHNALTQNATSADQISAVNTLPASDPTNGGHYWMATAEAKAVGLMSPSSGPDGSVGFSSSVAFDYDDSNGVSHGTYDFYGTFLHEVTEVMGRELFVGTAGVGSNAYTPLDLFHYSSSSTRTFSGTTPGYFSVNNGATNLDNFNINPNGDFGDWAASVGNDSFLAFSNSGVVNQVSQNDLRLMNVLGYNESPATALPNPGTSWHVIDAGDFNDDGHSDILWQNNDGSPSIWEMNGSSIVGRVALPNPGTSWHVIGAGDFNGDRHSDILWQNNDGSTSIWEMNGGSVTGWDVLPDPGPTWQAIGTGDFNGDGKSDILWQNNDGSTSIWEMNGGSVTGRDVLPDPGPTWHAIGTGDFNGDGKSDILWQNNDGSPSIWEMNGGSIVGWVALPNPGTSWHVISTGDFNGDRHSDILWQNTDGTPNIWFMNGSTIIAQSNASMTSESETQFNSGMPNSSPVMGNLIAPQPTLFSGDASTPAQRIPGILGATT